MLVEQSACEFAPGRVGKVRGKPLSADYILTHRGRPSHARVRARGTDIGFINKPRLVFSLSFFPSFLRFLFLGMSGSFRFPVHNSPAALAAGEIWIQKKRVVSDAPEAWIWGCCFMDFSLVCYLKTLPTLVGRGRCIH